MAAIARLTRYPVKSLLGEDVDALEVGTAGAAGDRMLAFRDAVTDEVLTAKRTAQLLEASARHRNGGVEVCLPGGDWRPAPSADLDAAASDWLGRAVRLVAPTADAPAQARVSFDLDDEDNDVFAWTLPPGTFFDLAPIHLLTTASLRAAARRHPDGQWVSERFRPTVVLDVDGDDFVEDGWVGERIGLGSVVIEITMPTIRCPMPTRSQGGLPLDLDIVKTLSRTHDGNLGVYASVVTPGTVSVGDEVRLPS